MLHKHICEQCWNETLGEDVRDEAGVDRLWDEEGRCSCAFLLCESGFYMLNAHDAPPFGCYFRAEQLLA